MSRTRRSLEHPERTGQQHQIPLANASQDSTQSGRLISAMASTQRSRCPRNARRSRTVHTYGDRQGIERHAGQINQVVMNLLTSVLSVDRAVCRGDTHSLSLRVISLALQCVDEQISAFLVVGDHALPAA